MWIALVENTSTKNCCRGNSSRKLPVDNESFSFIQQQMNLVNYLSPKFAVFSLTIRGVPQSALQGPLEFF